MVERKQNAPNSSISKAMSWLNSYGKASKWMSKYDIHRLLDAEEGIVRIENFLPSFVAEAVLDALQSIPDGRWNATVAGEDYAHNNISHQFYSIKHASAVVDAAVRVISLLLPGQLHAFSAARYDTSHHIAPHDDRAYTPVQLDTGEVITCSREIGVIWYLTQDWRPEYGGALRDLEAGEGGTSTYVPLFNSVVVFRVPRFHEVTPLTTARPRYSLFGWFLQPGKRYELFLGDGPQAAQQAQQQLEADDGKLQRKRRRRQQQAEQQEAAGGQGEHKRRRQQAQHGRGRELHPEPAGRQGGQAAGVEVASGLGEGKIEDGNGGGRGGGSEPETKVGRSGGGPGSTGAPPKRRKGKERRGAGARAGGGQAVEEDGVGGCGRTDDGGGGRVVGATQVPRCKLAARIARRAGAALGGRPHGGAD